MMLDRRTAHPDASSYPRSPLCRRAFRAQRVVNGRPDTSIQVARGVRLSALDFHASEPPHPMNGSPAGRSGYSTSGALRFGSRRDQWGQVRCS